MKLTIITMNTQLMVSYLEESCASDTDYSESDPLSGNHGDKNYRLPRTNRAAAVLLILVSIIILILTVF